MLLVIMEAYRGEPESAYSMHIVQNRAGTKQYTEERVVENLRGHTLVSCTVPNKKKLRDEYQRVPEAGAACNLSRDAETARAIYCSSCPVWRRQLTLDYLPYVS